MEIFQKSLSGHVIQVRNLIKYLDFSTRKSDKYMIGFTCNLVGEFETSATVDSVCYCYIHLLFVPLSPINILSVYTSPFILGCLSFTYISFKAYHTWIFDEGNLKGDVHSAPRIFINSFIFL